MTDTKGMRALDPTDPRFIDSTKLTGGDHANRSICDVGEVADGLRYLDLLVQAIDAPPWLSIRMRWAIERYLSRPAIASRLAKIHGR